VKKLFDHPWCILKIALVFLGLPFFMVECKKTLHDPSHDIQQQKKEKERITAILHRYDKKEDPPFSLCFGRPIHTMPSTQRKALLIYFSALTCPRCALFHGRHLPSLITMTRTKPLYLVIRDYPIDGLSLRGSACVWSPDLSVHRRKSVFSALFQSQKQWIADPKNATQDIAQKVITHGHITDKKNVNALHKSHQDTSETSIMQSLFTEHNTDQKIFDLQGVPFAVLIMQDREGTYKMVTFGNTNMDQEISRTIHNWLK
jgi:uncharacterized protein (DUF2141 family)